MKTLAWLADFLKRAHTAAEASAALDWSSEKTEARFVDVLIDSIHDKLNAGPPKARRKPRQSISCSECFTQVTVTGSGFVAYHGPFDERCPGSGRAVAQRTKPLAELAT